MSPRQLPYYVVATGVIVVVMGVMTSYPHDQILSFGMGGILIFLGLGLLTWDLRHLLCPSR